VAAARCPVWRRRVRAPTRRTDSHPVRGRRARIARKRGARTHGHGGRRTVRVGSGGGGGDYYLFASHSYTTRTPCPRLVNRRTYARHATTDTLFAAATTTTTTESAAAATIAAARSSATTTTTTAATDNGTERGAVVPFA